MISFKNGVLLYGTRPEVIMFHMTVCEIHAEFGYGVVVTSGRDSADGRVSKTLHDAGDEVPACFALDYSVSHILEEHRQKILVKLKSSLPFCDVVYHDVGSGFHYHIEFDPKNDPIWMEKKAAWKRGEKVIW